MSNLTDVKGIGKKVEEKLNRAGIKTINDLLFSFPTRYEMDQLNGFDEIEVDKILTLSVVVHQAPKVYFIRRNLDKLTVYVKMNNMFFHASIFNRRFLANALSPGAEIVITGKFINNLSNFTASNIILKKNFKPGIKAIYNIKDINDSLVRKAVKEILSFKQSLTETIPNQYLYKRNIPNINELIYQIHYPINEIEISSARKRIIYEELLDFALRIESLKKLNQNVRSIEKKYDIKLVKEFIKTLPYEMTKDQQLATNEIFKDLKSDRQMNRLLQGDVGSGKTIISVLASLAVVSAGYQVAVMAPTLVLAKQHLSTFKSYLKNFDVSVELLVSEQTPSERREILSRIKNNEIDIVIGTHSLIQESVDFHNLGFLVIDEQHRFGVRQRKDLREKGVTPDILLMSATPIPRTLAISIYKDIDISFIKEKPSGRKDIITDIVQYEDFDLMLEKVTKELDFGHQAYFICPKITESETSTKISVEEVYDLLKAKLKGKYTVGLLHGKLSDSDKDHILNKFYQNKIDILVSTTVVEVGVNVKNATVMAIMNANAFGLAQLHQLRGRIGRAEHQSYCYLVVDDLLESSDRLKIMKETNDGFQISEYDLSIRGPGEVFGNTQSGIPNFKMANLINDAKILEQALEDALEIVHSQDPAARILTNKAIKAIDSYNLD